MIFVFFTLLKESKRKILENGLVKDRKANLKSSEDSFHPALYYLFLEKLIFLARSQRAFSGKM